MPSLPRAQCAAYHCKQPAGKGSIYCQTHAPTKQTTDSRQAFNRPYKSQAWHAIRRAQLSKQPLCECCLTAGRVTQADHVDHVIPWQTIGLKAFAANLFQSMCPECHGMKSGQEKRGIFTQYSTGRQFTASDWVRLFEDPSTAERARPSGDTAD